MTVVKCALNDITMKVKNSTVKFIRRQACVGSLDSCFNLTAVLIQTLVKSTLSSQDEFLVEMIAVNVDRLPLTDIAD